MLELPAFARPPPPKSPFLAAFLLFSLFPTWLVPIHLPSKTAVPPDQTPLNLLIDPV
jgi:hypothetical protein